MSGLVNEVGSLVGGGNNNSQTTFTGPGGLSTSAILNPITLGQTSTAYGTAQDSLSQQQALAKALQGQTAQGIGTQTGLAQALAIQEAGGGPNPAQSALNTNTGDNVANTAALIAGQRGASQNIGLAARNAALTGATTQQAAVGQAATLQAQQQLAAQQAAAQLAATQVAQGTGQTNTTSNSAQAEQSELLGGVNNENSSNVAANSNTNSTNAGLATTNANNSAGFVQSLLGGAASGVGAKSVGGALAGAKGGKVTSDEIKPPTGDNPKLAMVPSKDRMPIPDHLMGVASIYHPNFAVGGSVVPGIPKVNHNSLKNDVVDAKLTPGEVVLPLDVMNAKDPGAEAKKFVDALRKNDKGGTSKEEGDFKAALKKSISARKK